MVPHNSTAVEPYGKTRPAERLRRTVFVGERRRPARWTFCGETSRVFQGIPRKSLMRGRSEKCNNRHKARRTQIPYRPRSSYSKLDRRRLTPQDAERVGLHCVDALASVNKATSG